MTPGQYIALARDVLIVAALGFVIWFLYHSGRQAAQVAQMEALEKQVQANAHQEMIWQQEHNDALAELSSELSSINGSIARNHTPVIVQNRPSGGVPGDPAKAANQPPESGGVDIRSGVNAFESKYETALAECRAALASWPH